MSRSKNPRNRKKEDILLDIINMENLFHKIQDVDILLEQILTEARNVVQADAGSIYIAENGKLAIHFAQNDTMQRRLPEGDKIPYAYFEFPINVNTIAGCAAFTKKLINEPDVYKISDDKPYKFGRATDMVTGYKTVSNLTVPLVSTSGVLLGVLQMLNGLDESGNIRAFDTYDEIYLSLFASNASSALEHAYLTRAMILRMIKMSELRDPKETGMHVQRVASYSVEIYDRWAFNHNIIKEKQNSFRAAFKIAAMLHDVGKVAISDSILKKPGKLTENEFELMQTHTWLGAKLFAPIDSQIDILATEIAMRHHENWDGSGYPGHICTQTGVPLKVDSVTGKVMGLKGDEIPISARIVALADVYDALSCKRVYKESWTEDDILDEIRQLSGRKFDPDVVKAFFEILPRIQAIKDRFSD